MPRDVEQELLKKMLVPLELIGRPWTLDDVTRHRRQLSRLVALDKHLDQGELHTLCTQLHSQVNAAYDEFRRLWSSAAPVPPSFPPPPAPPHRNLTYCSCPAAEQIVFCDETGPGCSKGKRAWRGNSADGCTCFRIVCSQPECSNAIWVHRADGPRPHCIDRIIDQRLWYRTGKKEWYCGCRW